ncbi:MAG: hypothetical protein Q7R97_00785 [Candidatus Daviesbacteria bacterium]|nr:hypothetical protein [Candidatus Daviesbacteria bacterium]
MSNPEHIEKLKRELFGYKDDSFSTPNPDTFIDLSGNHYMPFNEQTCGSLALIRQKNNEGETIHYSHMPSLLRDMLEHPNSLLFDISQLMDLMTDEEIEACEKYLDSPDDSQDFSK